MGVQSGYRWPMPRQGPPRRVSSLLRWTGAALSFVIFVFLLAVVRNASGEGPIGPDAAILASAAALHAPWLDTAVQIVTSLGEGWALGPMALVAAVFLYRVDRRSAIFVVAATLGAGVFHFALKWLVARPRPNGHAITWASDYSFPSGHATATFCFFIALTLVVRQLAHRRQWPALGVALALVVLIGATRVYLGVHYPSDVVAGWAVGGLWVGLLYAWYRRAFLDAVEVSAEEELDTPLT